MKNIIAAIGLIIFITAVYAGSADADAADAKSKPVIKIEIPASEVNRINVSYETQNNSSKALETTKVTAKKTVNTTKKATNKAIQATKEAAQKTADNTKDLIETINPNKPVTKEELEYSANLKTLKNEKKQLDSAYKSRIKDIDAKIKATQDYTDLTEVQKQNRVYLLQKQKAQLDKERLDYINKYNKQIEKAKAKKRSK